MYLLLSFIQGIGLGIEYVSPMPSEGIPNACVILDLVFLRFIVEIE
jgi:hypothetical protein